MLVVVGIERWEEKGEVKNNVRNIDKIEFIDLLIVVKYRIILIFGLGD